MPVAPPELIAESRKSEGRDPWIFLFEIQLDQASAVRIARNNEDVVFASETYEGWNLETTLDHLSLKAGLGPGAWREGARFQVFEAEVFAESR